MNVEVLFFGVLADVVKINKLQVNDIETLQALKDHLFETYPGIKSLKFQTAVNQNIETKNISLKNGDIIAFLPPFAGG